MTDCRCIYMKIGCIFIEENISIHWWRKIHGAEAIANDSRSFCEKSVQKRERESFAVQTSNGGPLIDLEYRLKTYFHSSCGILAGGIRCHVVSMTAHIMCPFSMSLGLAFQDGRITSTVDASLPLIFK